jgi:hypothetical protein
LSTSVAPKRLWTFSARSTGAVLAGRVAARRVVDSFINT